MLNTIILSLTINTVLTTTIYPPVNMNENVKNYLAKAEANFESISNERKKRLLEISEYISKAKKEKSPVQLTFICTHNSRRSHFGQIWAAVAAYYYGVDADLNTYSGGTEATAFNPRAVDAIKRVGFDVEIKNGFNPHYLIHYAKDRKPLDCFSKKFDDAANPNKDFAAIMTCSDADQNCPIIFGATARFSIPYDDPKQFDGTPMEQTKYDERCLQIATEMAFVMKNVK